MISLRTYTASDASRLADLANNANVSRFMGENFPHPYTRLHAEWWIASGSRANNAVTKVIEYRGEFVGSIGILPQSGSKQHAAEIGFWLGEAYWGQGIATTAVQMMTQFAFANLDCKKLYAPVLGPNESSMRVLEKSGYRLEGVFEYEVFKNGQFFDVYHYARHQP